jgi:hypothetical protein
LHSADNGVEGFSYFSENAFVLCLLVKRKKVISTNHLVVRLLILAAALFARLEVKVWIDSRLKRKSWLWMFALVMQFGLGIIGKMLFEKGNQ